MDLSPRLSALLNNALQYRVTEIVAPAGFGKTTLLDALAGSRSFVVARIRPDGNRVLALMRALCQAVAMQAPDLGRALPDAFENAASAGSLSDLVPWYWHSLPDGEVRIAIDDLHHLADDPGAWTLLCNLIESSEATRARWVLASRTLLDLPTIEWIARGRQGVSIREKELAFGINDVEHVAGLVETAVTEGDAREIVRIAKGWPLLVMYAMRLLAQGAPLSSLPATVGGRGIGAITDRLLATLTPEQVRLLHAIALYDGVLPEELELTNSGGSSGAYTLAVAGVPLTQGDDRRWRLHDVLREHMMERYPKVRVSEANRIALELEVLGKVDESLALAVAGASPETVQALLERHARYFADAGNPQMLRRALSAFSRNAVESSAQLALIRGIDEMTRGDAQLAIAFLRRAVVLSSDQKTYAMARLIQGFMNWEGHAAEAYEQARATAAAPQSADPEEACDVLGYVAQAFALSGDRDAATRAVTSSLQLLPRIKSPSIEARTYFRAAQVALLDSRLQDADAFIMRAISLGERHRLFDLLCRAYRLRMIVTSRDAENEAIECAKRAAHYAAKILNKRALYFAEASLFAFACRAGDLDEARALRGRLLPVPTDCSVRAGPVVLTVAAALSMMEGRYSEASTFLSQVDTFGESAFDRGLLVAREVMFQALSAVLHQLTGGSPDAVRVAARAIAIADNLESEGFAIGAKPEIEISKILCAAILGINGRTVEAERVLQDMSAYAHESYRRDLAAWTSAALSGAAAEPSAEARMLANGIIMLVRRCIGATQPVSLTPAELRVLESIAEGRSSKEIAAVTGRSVKTVDNQVTAILRKLRARSRGEAVARARRSGLLNQEERESTYASSS